MTSAVRRSPARRIAVAALAVGTAAVLVACGSRGPAAVEEAGPPQRGGDATIVLGVEAVRGLDPAMLFNLTPSGDANRMSAIYGTLLWADAATGAVSPGLAESLTPSADGAQWTLVLRPALTFSDGTPLDAEAVRFNYARIADPATRSPLAPLLAGVTTTVRDARTLQIDLATPNFSFDRVLATNLTFIGSPTAIAADPAGFANEPVGAGPFVLREWVRDDHMTLERNPTYAGPDEPLLDTVTFTVIADPTQRINTVASGQAQAAVPGSDLSFRDAAAQRRLAVTEAPAGGGPTFLFNTARAPFDDVRARRAVAMALDLADLDSVIDPGSAAPEGLFGPGSPFGSPGPLVEHDAAGAQQLLSQLAAEGKPVEFTVTLTPSGLFKRTAEYVQSRLSTFRDIAVTIDIVDNATIDQRVFRDRDYDMSAQIVPVPDPEPNLYKLLHSTGQTNYTGFADPALDAALDAARSTQDTAAREAAYATVQRIVADQVPILPFREQVAYTVHRPELTGLVLHGDGALLYDRLGLAAS
ncbi:ABC transporter substrate-binding protein [Pseudonocardia lacus]|uniref:ABC transporter substrate-binding protein n=1 Tax=Pseudonocardia lacus TaxID=2835865 RepID=UPI001BDCEFE9|nr:ABC transporter substrate-binding protein [Pseudonocardia lacus]